MHSEQFAEYTSSYGLLNSLVLAPVVQTLDSTMHWINCSPVDSILETKSDFAQPVKQVVEYYALLCTNSIVFFCFPLAVLHYLLVSVSWFNLVLYRFSRKTKLSIIFEVCSNKI